METGQAMPAREVTVKKLIALALIVFASFQMAPAAMVEGTSIPGMRRTPVTVRTVCLYSSFLTVSKRLGKWRNRRQRCKSGPMSVGADKAYDTRDFVATVRAMNTRPHVAQNVKRSGGSAIDGRTSRHASYAISQSKRPLIEKALLKSSFATIGQDWV